jgi:hypothetical protein
MRGALILALACVAFALGELIVRWQLKDAGLLYPRYHTDYRYGRYALRGIRPNAVFWHTSVDGSWKFVTNSRGFRNERDFAYEKPAGTLRLLAIGDSMTQGYEVRQDFTFPAAAERYLALRGLAAEALNAGVSGYSTGEALAFLESEGYKYRPDAVVLGFFANDFEDNLKAGLFALDESGALVERKFEYLPGVAIQNAIYAFPPMRWLGENSYFYSLAFNGAWVFFKDRAAAVAHARNPSHARAGSFEYAVPMKASLSEHDVALAAAMIERMQRFCRAHAMRLIVADIPDVRGTRPIPSMPPALVRRLQAMGVEQVSGSALLADYDGVAETHVPHGHRHISEFTHTMIGAEIGRRLANNSVVPQQHAIAQ